MGYTEGYNFNTNWQLFLNQYFNRIVFGLPKFIEDFNALFMLGIGMVGTYILWRKNKAGTLTEYEKRGWILTRTFLALFVLSVLVGVLVFLFMKYIYGIYI